MSQIIELKRVYNPLDHTDCDHTQWQFVPGSTVADLLDSTGALLHQRDSIRFAVAVNGIPVPEDQRAMTCLQPGQWVTVIPYLHGGGGGAKDIIRMVGMLALAIVAAPLAAGIAGFAVGMGAAAGLSIGTLGFTMMMGAAFVGIMVGGSMLLNAILPPAKPQLPTGSTMDQSNSYSWSPVTTQQQGIVIPVCYGTCRIQGNIIGAYRETIKDKGYVNALLSAGVGPLASLYDFKINGQNISNYSEFGTPHVRPGYLDDAIIENFGDTVIEYPQSAAISYGTQLNYTTIGSSFDALEIEVGCPNGLYYYDNNGNFASFSVDYSIEVRKSGESTWLPVTSSVSNYYLSSSGYWSAGQWSEEYFYTSDSSGYAETVWHERANGGSDANAYYEGQKYDQYGNSWRWIGEPLRISATGNVWARMTDKRQGLVAYAHRISGLAHGTYDVRINRLSVEQTDTRYGDDLYLLNVREYRMDDFIYPGLAKVGIRGLATDQLSGSFGFECMTSGKLCRVYNGSSWSVEATSNPAWICFDILTQPVINASHTVLEYAAYDPSQLDLARFTEWAAYCDDLVPDGNGGTEKRLTYNGAFDAAQNLWDAVLAVARIGRATPYWRGSAITVAIDKPADPVTMITVGNIGLDSFEETFLPLDNRAGSVEADFLNLEKGLERDKLTIVNPDAPSDWGSAPLALQGVIKPSEVWRHCRFHLATTQALLRVVTVNMDIDAIAFTLGDIVNVQHDVPMWGEGGRLVSATTTSVTLDKSVTLASGLTYAVMVRMLDGTLVTRAISTAAGTYSTLTVATPFVVTPDAFDIYAFGQTDTVVKPMRVVGIDPAGDLMRKITLTDYNSTIYNADTLDPVLPTINYSALALPAVDNLKVVERLTKQADGTISNNLVITFTAPVSTVWRYAEIMLFAGGAWVSLGQSVNGAEIVVPCKDAATYIVRAESVGWAGQRLPLAQCPTYTITTLGKTAPPLPVTGLQAELTRGQMRIYWAAGTEVDIAGYDLQLGTTWDDPANKVLVTGYAGTSYAWTPDRTGTISILAKSIDTSGNYSTTAARLDYTISGPGTVASLTQQVIDSIVELKWTAAAAGSFPIDYYEVWKGSTFATAELLGRKYSTFDLLQETVAGTYKYWIRAVDVAGLAGAETGVYAAVNQPPDYVLIDQQNLVFEECTLTNALIENGQVVLPINTTISFENHFINNPDTTLEPWSTPQDQIDDGYTLYGQPGPATASIERVIDYGAVIPSSKLTMSVTRTALAGSVTFTPELLVSVDGSSYTSLGNVYESAATGFRYAKYRLVATTADGGMAAVHQINTKLDVKQKTFVTNTVNVTDTVSDGTQVTFASLGLAPVDITGIVAEAPYTGNTTNDPIKALINFTDTANPTSFKVLCWNKSGTRVACSGVTVTIRYI